MGLEGHAAGPRALHGAARRGRPAWLTWVPWTHGRLAAATGYRAGMGSPGWYHHLFTAPDKPIVRWLTLMARGPILGRRLRDGARGRRRRARHAHGIFFHPILSSEKLVFFFYFIFFNFNTQ